MGFTDVRYTHIHTQIYTYMFTYLQWEKNESSVEYLHGAGTTLSLSSETPRLDPSETFYKVSGAVNGPVCLSWA